MLNTHKLEHMNIYVVFVTSTTECFFLWYLRSLYAELFSC